MFYINTTAEEFETVVRAFVSLAVFDGSSVTYSVESESVGFMFRIEGISAVFDTYIF